MNDYASTFGKTPIQQAQEKEKKKSAKNQGELLMNAVATLIEEVKALRREVKELDRKISRRR